MKGLNVGVEIECAILRERFRNLNIGSYHNGAITPILKGWETQTDGSLSTMRRGFICVEIVSKKAKTKKEFMRYINSFYAFFSKRGREELHNVMEFNSHTGTHISFSFNPLLKKLTRFSHYNNFEQLRKMFIDRIGKSEIINKDAKEIIISSYDRYHARIYEGFKEEKYSEFNVLHECENGRIEWRSPSMRGLNTWSEFFEWINITYSCIEDFITLSNKYSVTESLRLSNRDISELMQLLNDLNSRNTVSIISLNNIHQEAERQFNRTRVNSLTQSIRRKLYILCLCVYRNNHISYLRTIIDKWKHRNGSINSLRDIEGMINPLLDIYTREYINHNVSFSGDDTTEGDLRDSVGELIRWTYDNQTSFNNEEMFVFNEIYDLWNIARLDNDDVALFDELLKTLKIKYSGQPDVINRLEERNN